MSTPRQRPSSASSHSMKRNGKVVATSTNVPQAPALLPAIDDRDGWRAHWQAQGQPWRTEPEIDQKRQQELDQYRKIPPNIEKGIYPFKEVKLNRADIEWLLATIENEYGTENQTNRYGLDLRGADLRNEDLHNMPLMYLQGGLSWQEWGSATSEQQEAAAIHLEGANLRHARLEKATLRGAHLESANLYAAHLEGAGLYSAHLEGALLKHALFDGDTQLRRSILENKMVGCAFLADIRWGDVNVTGINWATITVVGEERKALSMKRITKDKRSLMVEYLRALRTNRQLATVLQAQGLNEDAARFAYHAEVLQKMVLWLQLHQSNVTLKQRIQTLGSWFFSWFLFLFAGYGYKVWRSFLVYILTICIFMILYLWLDPHLAWYEALVVSMTAFHGRGFSSTTFSPSDPLSIASAIEAFVGLVIEVTLIVTLTQRFFNG